MSAFAWTDHEVRVALGLPSSDTDPVAYGSVSTDSRSIEAGDLFVALAGDRFDGHDHVSEAVARGATGAVVSRKVEAQPLRLYPVNDTLDAFGCLASHRRQALPAHVVGITGSVGKTTAKDLTRGALQGTVRIHATSGNLNNQIGVPRTLLDAPLDAQVVVVEMGTNEPGEIGILTAMASPGIGVVTTIGDTHLEKLGSREGVLTEKLELLRGLPPTGHAVVGDDPPELPEAARLVFPSVQVAGWSDRADAALRPTDVRIDDAGCHAFVWNGRPVALRIPGRHAVLNALLALAVAELLGVDAGEAAIGVSAVEPANMRGEIRELGGLTVLVDCYNANPQSVSAALDLLATLPATDGHVAVLGSMLELGTHSDGLHDTVLHETLDRGLALTVATGEFAAAAARSPLAAAALRDGTLAISTPVEGAYDAMAGRLRAGVALLIKGSRGVRLERLLEPLERDFGPSSDLGGGV